MKRFLFSLCYYFFARLSKNDQIIRSDSFACFWILKKQKLFFIYKKFFLTDRNGMFFLAFEILLKNWSVFFWSVDFALEDRFMGV